MKEWVQGNAEIPPAVLTWWAEWMTQFSEMNSEDLKSSRDRGRKRKRASEPMTSVSVSCNSVLQLKKTHTLPVWPWRNTHNIRESHHNSF
jgi:hypothetical protein